MASSITFTKCKRGAPHIFYYYDEATCSKLFINSDHLKIIVYDSFKLPITKLHKYLKSIGFVIYREVIITDNTSPIPKKMFRIVGTKTICSFHELKDQYPKHITCCLNDNGLKIPGSFQMSEILNLSKNMIEFFKKLELEEITEVAAVVEPSHAPQVMVSATVVEAPPQVMVSAAAAVVEAPPQKIVIEHFEEVSSLAENKLLYAESELRIAQIKHNISYLEWCMEEELKYRNTLQI